MPRINPGDVYPPSNLPPEAVQWGRRVQDDQIELKKGHRGLDQSMKSLSRSVSSALSRSAVDEVTRALRTPDSLINAALLQEIPVTRGPAPPNSPTPGHIWSNTAQRTVLVFDGPTNEWVEISGGDSGGFQTVTVTVNPANASGGELIVPVPGLGSDNAIVAPASLADASLMANSDVWFTEGQDSLVVDIGDLDAPVEVTVTWSSSLFQTIVSFPEAGFTGAPGAWVQERVVSGLGTRAHIASPVSLQDASLFAGAGAFFTNPAPGVLRASLVSAERTTLNVLVSIMGDED